MTWRKLVSSIRFILFNENTDLESHTDDQQLAAIPLSDFDIGDIESLNNHTQNVFHPQCDPHYYIVHFI